MELRAFVESEIKNIVRDMNGLSEEGVEYRLMNDQWFNAGFNALVYIALAVPENLGKCESKDTSQNGIPVLVRCSNCRVLDTPSVTNNHATLEINLHCKNCGKLIKALNESEAKIFNDMRKRGMA